MFQHKFFEHLNVIFFLSRFFFSTFFFSFGFILIKKQDTTLHFLNEGVPTEVIVKILERLSFKDQLTCQYVSKAWRKVALSCFDGVAILKGGNIICKLIQV